MKIRATDKPVITVRTGGSKIEGAVEVTVMNPFGMDQGYEAIIMKARIQADILFLLSIDSHVLGGGLKNTTMVVDSLKTLFYATATVEKLNQGNIGSWADQVSSALNHLIYDSKLGLALANPVEFELSTTRLFVYDNFLLVDSIQAEIPTPAQ